MSTFGIVLGSDGQSNREIVMMGFLVVLAVGLGLVLRLRDAPRVLRPGTVHVGEPDPTAGLGELHLRRLARPPGQQDRVGPDSVRIPTELAVAQPHRDGYRTGFEARVDVDAEFGLAVFGGDLDQISLRKALLPGLVRVDLHPPVPGDHGQGIRDLEHPGLVRVPPVEPPQARVGDEPQPFGDLLGPVGAAAQLDRDPGLGSIDRRLGKAFGQRGDDFGCVRLPRPAEPLRQVLIEALVGLFVLGFLAGTASQNLLEALNGFHRPHGRLHAARQASPRHIGVPGLVGGGDRKDELRGGRGFAGRAVQGNRKGHLLDGPGKPGQAVDRVGPVDHQHLDIARGQPLPTSPEHRPAWPPGTAPGASRSPCRARPILPTG